MSNCISLVFQVIDHPHSFLHIFPEVYHVSELLSYLVGILGSLFKKYKKFLLSRNKRQLKQRETSPSSNKMKEKRIKQ